LHRGPPPRLSDTLAALVCAAVPLALLDSLFDFPRIGLLVYLLPMCALFDARKSMPRRII
jgi:hypothetical protein